MRGRPKKVEPMARRPSAHTMILSRRVPKLPGPNVHGVRIDDPGATLYVAMVLPLEPPTGKIATGPIRKQTELVLSHLKTVVEEGGFKLDHVVRCTLYVTDFKHMDIINEVYGKMFVSLALPARSVVQVAGLPHDLLIGLDAVAIKAREAVAQAPGGGMPEYDDQDMY
jgi:2-iminobutanoate/2-iminopropanoate deaminase